MRIALLLALLSPLTAYAQDAPGCADDPLFPTRMPGYRLDRCETKPFASYDFFVTKGQKKTVEGAFTFLTYGADRKDDRSGLEVIRNYENALKKIGAKIHGSDPQRWVNGWLVVDGNEVWAQAEKGNGKIWIRIVRTKEMTQTIVADAAALADDLRATGHVAVYGVYFDSGKAELKPASAPALTEIAKLLKADAQLELFVVGHTDSVGSVEANAKLSQDRAQAVIHALTHDHAIAAARLRPFGNGPYAPVASNENEEGRAKNRRVELVKR